MTPLVENFRLSGSQAAQLGDWLVQTAYPAAIARQRSEAVAKGDLWARSAEAAWEQHRPYYGAGGLGLIYEFRPNSFGVAVQVTESITGLSISLTNMDDW